MIVMIDIVSKEASRGIMQQKNVIKTGKRQRDEVNTNYGVHLSHIDYSIQERQSKEINGAAVMACRSYFVFDRVSCSHRWIHPIELRTLPIGNMMGLFRS